MNRLKKIWKDTTGVALITVLGIMTVVAILATGMFYFSTNELGFSTMDTNRAQAQYLARAGVEIAAKAFPTVSGSFAFQEGDPPVVTEPIYLDAEGGFDGTAEDNKGSAIVTITKESRTATDTSTTPPTTSEFDVWVYRCDATLGVTRAKAMGYTMPVAYAATDPEEEIAVSRNYMGWVTDGKPKMSTGDKEGDMALNSVSGGLIQLIFGGSGKKIPVYARNYYGVVVADAGNVPTLTMNDATDKVYVWQAPALYFESQINLNSSKAINVFVAQGKNIVFDKSIQLYANNLESRIGDLVLAPVAEGTTSNVYFKESVYLNIGSNRVRIIDAGTAYSFDKNIDLFQYAVDTNPQVRLGFSGFIRNLINQWVNGSGEKYQTSDLTPLQNTTPPSTNALGTIIWE